jgi:tetratricopeptide (TPR) repeat protein
MIKPCAVPEIRKMLYAYELGLLDEKDRERVERHLMDCEDCFETARAFEDTAGLLKNSPAVRAEVAEGQQRRAGATTSRIWRLWVPAAAILVLLLLKPWQFEFRPDLQAVAAENRLAILPFEYGSGELTTPGFVEMISELLAADLSESNYIQVVSSQRISDIERLMNRERESDAPPVSADEIALRAKARLMLTGRIHDAEGGWLVTSQLVEVASGLVEAAQEMFVDSTRTVFELVDMVSAAVRLDLELPRVALEEDDPPVATLTTHSAEAYNAFLEGVRDKSRLYLDEAIADFERAVAADSTFAMAYYHLSELKDPDLIHRAAEYAGGATQREQFYIRAGLARVERDNTAFVRELTDLVQRFPDEKEAYRLLGQHYVRYLEYDSAIICLNRAVEVDSLFKEAYNLLTYAYDGRGDYADAVRAINTYIQLAPGEANPYDTRGDLYAGNGGLEKAIESYRMALDRKPDFSASAFKLVAMYVFAGDFAQADSVLDTFSQSGSAEVRFAAGLFRVYSLMYRGALEDALAAIDATDADVRRLAETSAMRPKSSHLAARAAIYSEMGEPELAVTAIKTAIAVNDSLSPSDSLSYRYLLAQYLAEAGHPDSAREIAQMYRAYYDQTGRVPCYRLWVAGNLALTEGRNGVAVDSFAAAASFTSVRSDFYANHYLARSYLADGRLADAVNLLEALQDIYTTARLSEPFAAARLSYYLGIAYEESRWYDKAAEQYRVFLDNWREADSNLVGIKDARSRLARLKAGS